MPLPTSFPSPQGRGQGWGEAESVAASCVAPRCAGHEFVSSQRNSKHAARFDPRPTVGRRQQVRSDKSCQREVECPLLATPTARFNATKHPPHSELEACSSRSASQSFSVAKIRYSEPSPFCPQMRAGWPDAVLVTAVKSH